MRLIQSMCAMCSSNLADLTLLSLLYIVLPCVAAVVSRPAWRMFVYCMIAWYDCKCNKRRLLLPVVSRPKWLLAINSTQLNSTQTSFNGRSQFLQERPRAYEENEDGILQGLTVRLAL